MATAGASTSRAVQPIASRRAPGSRRRRDVHRRGGLRRARAAHGEGADHARRPVAGGARRGRGGARARRRRAPDQVEALRPRDDRRHQRAARASAARARRWSPPAGFTDLLDDRPPGPPPPLPALRAEADPAGRRRAPLRGRASGSAPTGVVEPLAEAELERIADRGAATRRRVGRRLPAVLLPRPRPRARRSPSACEPSCPASTSRPRTRCCRSFASTSAARPR